MLWVGSNGLELTQPGRGANGDGDSFVISFAFLLGFVLSCCFWF